MSAPGTSSGLQNDFKNVTGGDCVEVYFIGVSAIGLQKLQKGYKSVTAFNPLFIGVNAKGYKNSGFFQKVFLDRNFVF